MPRIRSIHYDAWKSRKLAQASPEAERVYWRLQPLCDDAGRAEDDPELIAATLFPLRRDISPGEVDGWLDELDVAGLIVRYEVDGKPYLEVDRWHDYQHPRRPQASQFPPPPPDGSRRVRTSTDNRARCTDECNPEGSGVEMEWSGGEGESEGEVEPRRPVDNFSAAPAAEKARRLHQKAAEIEAARSYLQVVQPIEESA